MTIAMGLREPPPPDDRASGGGESGKAWREPLALIATGGGGIGAGSARGLILSEMIGAERSGRFAGEGASAYAVGYSDSVVSGRRLEAIF
jgi:hypothetical protein